MIRVSGTFNDLWERLFELVCREQRAHDTLVITESSLSTSHLHDKVCGTYPNSVKPVPAIKDISAVRVRPRKRGRCELISASVRSGDEDVGANESRFS